MKNKTTLSTKEISGLFGLTPERLRQLAHAGHFLKPERGRWDLQAVAGGLVAHLQSRLAAKRTTPEFDRARENKMTSEARLAEIALAEKEKKLIRRDVVLRVWQGHCIAARQIIQASGLSKEEQHRVLNELAISAQEYDE
jgi:hypothetical protein